MRLDGKVGIVVGAGQSPGETIGTGRAAGGEDEVGTGRGRGAAEHAVVEDDQATIEQFAHLDAHAGVGAATA